MTKGGSKDSKDIENKAVYKMDIKNPDLEFNKDNEYKDKLKSGYIETDDKIPVKQIKRRNIKKKLGK
jgi:hypothetical protein